MGTHTYTSTHTHTHINTHTHIHTTALPPKWPMAKGECAWSGNTHAHAHKGTLPPRGPRQGASNRGCVRCHSRFLTHCQVQTHLCVCVCVFGVFGVFGCVLCACCVRVVCVLCVCLIGNEGESGSTNCVYTHTHTHPQASHARTIVVTAIFFFIA